MPSAVRLVGGFIISAMRAWATSTVAVLMVAGLLLVSPSPLFASHPFDTLSVREAQAYRHVLEDDDRLVLIRYAMSDTPPADESAYSFDAAMLRLVDGSTTLQQLNPPLAGYGLVAFYFSAVDADTLVPWQSATIQAEIEGNPTLFESPQFDSTDSSTFVWNSTASVTSTAAELELDLPALLRSLETDDPDRVATDYVTVVGEITLDGGTLIALAFPQLLTIAAGAFQIATASVGSGFDPPTSAAFASSTQATGQASTWTQDVFAFGSTFGMPAAVAGMVLLMVIAGVMAYAISKFGGDYRALSLMGGPLLYFGAITGTVPFLAVVSILILVSLAGTGVLIRRILPD